MSASFRSGETGSFPMDDAPFIDELVSRAQQSKDKAAFQELVKRHQRMVWRQCMRAVRRVEMADELAQQIFLKAFDKIDSFRGEAPFGAWLCRIAFNTIADWRRRQKDEDHVDVDDVSIPVHVTYEDDLARDRKLAHLKTAIDALPEKQQQVVMLRVYEDFSFKEIAAALGGTEGSAKVNFHYALKTLKTLMQGSNQ